MADVRNQPGSASDAVREHHPPRHLAQRLSMRQTRRLRRGKDATVFLIGGRRPPRFRWVAPTEAKPRERGIRVQGHPALTACKVTQPSLRYDSAPDFEAQASAH